MLLLSIKIIIRCILKTLFVINNLIYLNPPFNQGKDYNHHNENIREEEYWN